MKNSLLAIALAAAAVSAYAGVNVNVNLGLPTVVVGAPVVAVGEPNFYGSIDVGMAPPPPGMYTPAPGVTFAVGVTPLYLHVPVGHMHDWRRHCGYYNACGRPVYFVNDNWYRNTYAPRYRNEHAMHQEEHHEHDDHRDHHDDRHDDHHGHDEHHDDHHDHRD